MSVMCLINIICKRWQAKHIGNCEGMRIHFNNVASALFYLLSVLACTKAVAMPDKPVVELVMQQQVSDAIHALDNGAGPDQATSGNTTALMCAAYLGEPELARRLLDAGALPCARNVYGATA